MRKTSVFLLVAGFVLGCSSSEDDRPSGERFTTEFGRAACLRLSECFPERFAAKYATYSDDQARQNGCVRELQDSMRAKYSSSDLQQPVKCERSEAQACVDGIYQLRCEAFDDVIKNAPSTCNEC